MQRQTITISGLETEHATNERRYRKAVTVVSGVDIPKSRTKLLISNLRSSLATGSTVDGNSIEIQGDYRDCLPALLADYGYNTT